jgi:subtilase family protein
MRRPTAALSWVLASFALLGSVTNARAQPIAADLAAVTAPSAAAGRGEQTPGLTWSLDLLAKRSAVAKAASPALAVAAAFELSPQLAAMRDAGLVRTDGDRVQVWGWVKEDLAEAATLLRSLGAEVERQEPVHRLLQAWVPVSALAEVARSGLFRAVSLPSYGVVNAGAVTSQGDALLNAALLRSTAGVDGSGVSVGLTSDSVKGYATAIASGDLPTLGSGNLDLTTCNTKGNDPASFGGGEGTAMLEIVHDLAPGARLVFGNWGFATALDFNATIDCLAANTDVVVDDIGFFNAGPYDGTSFISQNTNDELNRTSNRVRLYATSVANQATAHYQETFDDSGVNLAISGSSYRMHRVVGTASTSNAGLSLTTCGGVPCSNPLVLAQGATVTVLLQWNDSFAGSSNDYDVFLYDRATATFVANSDDNQNGSQPPAESFAYTNPHAKGTFDILIGRFSGVARTFDMFVICNGCDTLVNGAKINFNTVGSSVPNQSDAGGGVISVGAINSGDPNTDDIAVYSSRGPTNDGRMKPDVTAIDGVSVTGAAGFSNPFFGTSAAAPHVAGIAALLLDKAPALLAGEPGDNPAGDRATLRNAILSSAHDRGVAGADNTFGAGLADALAAGALVGTTGGCVRDATTACLQSSRFEVKVTWTTTAPATGSAQVMSFGGQRTENDESVFFTFFSATNFEMGVKVLNACVPFLGNKYWVFVSGLTDQGWTVTVRDTLTGATKTYSNPAGHLSTTFADTLGFGC